MTFAGRHPQGFSLVEVLIGLAFFSICIVLGLGIVARNRRGFDDSWLTTQATLQAQELMDSIKMAQWDELGRAGQMSTVLATLGMDATPYNDIDDWNDYSDSSGHFERTVTVQFLRLDNSGGDWRLVPDPGPTDTKEVAVKIYTKAGVGKTIRRVFVNASGVEP